MLDYNGQYSQGKVVRRTDAGFLMLVENDIEEYRCSTLLTKEPETIAWIRSFPNDCIFYDIGANIGVYSLFCRSIHDAAIIRTFEPYYKNLERLQENAFLNHWRAFDPKSVCAVGDCDGWIRVYSEGAVAGISDIALIPDITLHAQAQLVPIYTVDSLTTMFHVPTHIKIDVDGYEIGVVRGMTKTLTNHLLRSVLIEVEEANKEPIVEIFTAAGFTTDNVFNTMSPHSRERRKDNGIAVENVVFTR